MGGNMSPNVLPIMGAKIFIGCCVVLAINLAAVAAVDTPARGWHHRLRDGESYGEKWTYVQENPFRKGLVQRIEDWPFKGRVFDLVWSGK